MQCSDHGLISCNLCDKNELDIVFEPSPVTQWACLCVLLGAVGDSHSDSLSCLNLRHKPFAVGIGTLSVALKHNVQLDHAIGHFEKRLLASIGAVDRVLD